MKKNLYLTAKDCTRIRIWNKTKLSWCGGIFSPRKMRTLCEVAKSYQNFTGEEMCVCGMSKFSKEFIIIKEFVR